MQKNKIVSLISAICLLLTFNAIGVLAADVTGVTAESLAGNQLTNYIVSNLNLPEGITWSSSNTAVIANDGTVTRPLSEDATVTLTGDDGVNTENFTFTVKARTTNVAAQNSFYYPDMESELNVLNNGLDGWTRSKTTGVDESQIKKNASGNYYLYLDFNSASNITRYTFDDPMTGEFEVRWDMAYDHTSATSTIMDVYATYRGTLKADPSTTTDISLKISRLQAGAIRYYNNGTTTHTGWTYTSGETICYGAKINLDDCTYTFGRTDKAYPSVVSINTSSLTSDYDWSLATIYLQRGSSAAASGIITMDNFYVTQTQDMSEAIGSMSDAEKVSLYANAITKESITSESAAAIRSDLTLDASYSAYGDTGVTVTWASANPGIATDGTVTAGEMPRYGALTATITAGAETATKTFEFTVASAGTQNYHNTLTLDFEGKEGTVPEDSAPFRYATSATYESDADKGGTILKLVSASGSGQVVTETSTKTALGASRFMISADLKYTLTSGKTFGFIVNGNGASAQLQFNFETRKISMYYWTSSQAETFDMPETLLKDKWFHLDIDMNTMSRSYKAYIDGENLNVSGIPYQMTNAKNIGTKPMRYVQLYLYNPGEVYMDNLAVNEFTDADAVRADAAVNAVLVTYAGKNVNNNNVFGINTILTSASLPAAGPSDGLTYVTGSDITEENHANYIFSGGAALSYTANGTALQSGTIAPTAAGTITYGITATSGSAVATGSFIKKQAPVIIESADFVDTDSDGARDTVNSVTLNTAVPTGVVVVGAYNGDKLTGIKMVSAASTTVDVSYTAPKASTVKVFVMDASTYQPLAFASQLN